jgi:hypothetical protein
LAGFCVAGYAQQPLETEQAPTGWHLAGSAPANYRTGIDWGVTQNGQPSAYLRSVASGSAGFGTLMQSISATAYAGKRVRLRAWVSSKDLADWAGVWMRVDKGSHVVAFDNMQNRAVRGTAQWGAHDVVLDVPVDATSISFGILLSGAGEVWMGNLSFEVVDDSVAVTSKGPSAATELPVYPVNLDFTE